MTGAEIRATRLRLGLSQAALARALGLPDPERGGQVTVSRWESGKQKPQPYLRLALERLDWQRSG